MIQIDTTNYCIGCCGYSFQSVADRSHYLRETIIKERLISNLVESTNGALSSLVTDCERAAVSYLMLSQLQLYNSRPATTSLSQASGDATIMRIGSWRQDLVSTRP